MLDDSYGRTCRADFLLDSGTSARITRFNTSSTSKKICVLQIIRSSRVVLPDGLFSSRQKVPRLKETFDSEQTRPRSSGAQPPPQVGRAHGLGIQRSGSACKPQAWHAFLQPGNVMRHVSSCNCISSASRAQRQSVEGAIDARHIGGHCYKPAPHLPIQSCNVVASSDARLEGQHKGGWLSGIQECQNPSCLCLLQSPTLKKGSQSLH